MNRCPNTVPTYKQLLSMKLEWVTKAEMAQMILLVTDYFETHNYVEENEIAYFYLVEMVKEEPQMIKDFVYSLVDSYAIGLFLTVFNF